MQILDLIWGIDSYNIMKCQGKLERALGMEREEYFRGREMSTS